MCIEITHGRLIISAFTCFGWQIFKSSTRKFLFMLQGVISNARLVLKLVMQIFYP
jgi:hypothetical protein